VQPVCEELFHDRPTDQHTTTEGELPIHRQQDRGPLRPARKNSACGAGGHASGLVDDGEFY
jgi:hypothetical protein